MISATKTFINSSLARAAVSAVTVVGDMREANATPDTIDSRLEATSVEASPDDVDVRVAKDSSNQIVVDISSQATEYDSKDEKRFDELVILRAKGVVTDKQQEEFRKLQAMRRTALQDNSPDAILAEFQRRQVLIDAVKFLNRHVRLLQPEDQKRFRTNR